MCIIICLATDIFHRTAWNIKMFSNIQDNAAWEFEIPTVYEDIRVTFSKHGHSWLIGTLITQICCKEVAGLFSKLPYISLLIQGQQFESNGLNMDSGYWLKHTTNLVWEWIKQTNIRVQEEAWPQTFQENELMPKSQVSCRKSTRRNELCQFCQKHWSNIHPEASGWWQIACKHVYF